MTDEELIQSQLELEEESRALGVARYRQQRNKWTEVLGVSVDEASLPPGRKLLRKALIPTTEAVEAFLASARSGRAGRKSSAINLLPEGTQAAPLAYLTLRSAIHSAARSARLQKASIQVADVVAEHLEATALERVNPRLSAVLRRRAARRKAVSEKWLQITRSIHQREGVALMWSQRDKLLIGSKLIELAAEATGLFEIVLIVERRGGKPKSERQLQLTGAVEDWLERQHSRCELLDPVPMPMLVEPRPWTDPFDGGYLMQSRRHTLVGTHSRPYLEELCSIDMPRVYSAVNMIQASAWKINAQVLAAMRGRLGWRW